MSKEWKAPDKVTQKMTRDGAVCGKPHDGRNNEYQQKAAGGSLAQAPTAAAEKAVDRIGARLNGKRQRAQGKKPLTQRS